MSDNKWLGEGDLAASRIMLTRGKWVHDFALRALADLAAAKALLRECNIAFKNIGVEESLDLEARIRAVPGVVEG